MKKQISILGFLLLSSIAQAQITIQTTVKGYGNRVGIGYWKNLTYNEDTLQLNMNKASFKLDSSIPIYFKFRTIDPDTYTPFFMAFPGDIIAIEKDSDHFTIKGGAESYNRFLIKTDSEMRAAFTGKRLDYNATTKYLLDRSEEFFSSFNYPNKQMLKDLYTLSVITNYKLYPIISKYNNDTSKMNGLFQLLRNQKRSSNDDDILKYIDQVNFNNPNMGYASMSDIIMMNNFIMILRTQAIKKDSTLRDIDEYIIDNRLIKDLFKESRYRSRLLAYNLYSRIESYTQYPMLLAQVNDFIDDFRKEEFSSELTPPIEKLYASQLSTIGALAKGAIAPA
ncbi:MAG TPA: hypothetical protein VHA52_02485, partial [Candidatus Babeliaceae bacterium]|nr:hypothetical protein [Candidatus Babeliaceae bacterium]